MPDLHASALSPPSGQTSRWLAPTDVHLRSLLSLPELTLVSESCQAERHLHEELFAAPRRIVDRDLLAAVADSDARSNYETFLGFRDALLAAGSFEAYYLALVRGGPIAVPPVFIAAVVEAIVAGLFAGSPDPFERRAAQLLHRTQRITLSQGRVLAADRDTADRMNDDGSDIVGALMRQGGDAAFGASMPVLGADNAHAFDAAGDPSSFVFDLTHEVTNELGHGLAFTMTRTHSGLAALARVLERWLAHFLGLQASIRPLQRIDDPAWAWHIGLDVESSAILDDLYRGLVPDAGRIHQLIGLFRLDIADKGAIRAGLVGKPIYLGMAMSEEHKLKLKPQNLLLNLPLGAPT